MSFTKTQKIQALILLSIIISLLPWLFWEAIPQDLSYHKFSDRRTFLNIPNFYNVISNLPFLIVGVWGLIRLPKMQLVTEVKIAYSIFFVGIFFVGLGSGYYHWNPNNLTLVWDRLPMTVGFMALFAIILSEQIDVNMGRRLLAPLIIAGVVSVFYWYWTEKIGQGDLRLYGLIQFLPILLIIIILNLFEKRFDSVRGYYFLIGAYAFAKICEHFDAQIFKLNGVLSGHSLKHIIAAIGIGWLAKHYLTRRSLSIS